MVRLDDVIDALLEHHPAADADLVRRAYVFSAQAHRGQTRRNGEPYLVHPLEVSHIVSQLRLDTASVVAALLHDTVEDTVATVDEIEAQFGQDIAFLVQGLTKLEKINFHSAEEAQAENFRKMLVAMSRDLRVILVKLADRLHNMRTLTHLREDKQRRIAKETLDIYAPLANRLGINWIKTELEDLSFKYLYPEEYRALADRIAKTRSEREAYIQRVIGALRGELTGHAIKAEVTGRPKHLWSIRQKLKTSGREFDHLFDILAFRIIVDRVAECYEALGLVHSLWKPVPGRFKDYIALPKDNSYQSLHTAVLGPEAERIEIQIRTLDMHRTAELGVAAHWAYKEGQYGLTSKGADHRFAWLKQLLEWQRDLTDPTDFMETVKVDLFANEVYVFTPEGDVRAFPRGATPVDFAYAIHTDLGHECTGARVNGTQVSLRHNLQNGDVVEILRTKGSKPNPDWVKFVKTGRAATKIRAFVRQEENARSHQIGQELLEKELKRYGVGLNKLRRSGRIEAALEKLKFNNEREMLVALGYGKAQVQQLLPDLLPEDKLSSGPKEVPPEARESAFKRLMKKVLPKGKGGITVDGLEGVALHFPNCCAPVNGDEIVGFVTRGRGVTIHRKDCPRVLDYDPARRVDVHWDTSTRQVRPVEIRVFSADTPGLLASMSQSFHNAGVNITAVNCKTTPDRRAVNNFTVLVNDLDQLNRVMRMIERIEGVSSVERVAS
ncbi:MAG: bifunctional (p)ppGpp synthetase/guanosine-3',5'-bis(diphosphate) 3'-pyrophosphohydrolase [Myxococcales bacterium]|nr:bifunctional (p)ppGpp synthetase/guanosine-3',5'-bis(diphosphate) 3'-pyrophosphohydrolase [Myxococcales bacterium]